MTSEENRTTQTQIRDACCQLIEECNQDTIQYLGEYCCNHLDNIEHAQGLLQYLKIHIATELRGKK